MSGSQRPRAESLLLVLMAFFALAAASRADEAGATPSPAKAEASLGAFTVVEKSQPYKPITIEAGVFTSPRPVRAWLVRIDLTSPDIKFVATPPGKVEPPAEVACMTTLDFAKTEKLQLAFNASPFGPLRQKPGEPMDVVGLSASDGRIFSEPHESFGMLLIDSNGAARVVEPPLADELRRTIDDAVGGFRVLVRGGRSLADEFLPKENAKFAGVNPRTAVGLSADGKTMIVLVADGRQPGVSEGLTLVELAEWGIRSGCDVLLNLDGGGSTTLVLQDPASGEHRVLNKPSSSGKLRLVANSLGFARAAFTG